MQTARKAHEDETDIDLEGGDDKPVQDGPARFSIRTKLRAGIGDLGGNGSWYP